MVLCRSEVPLDFTLLRSSSVFGLFFFFFSPTPHDVLVFWEARLVSKSVFGFFKSGFRLCLCRITSPPTPSALIS